MGIFGIRSTGWFVLMSALLCGAVRAQDVQDPPDADRTPVAALIERLTHRDPVERARAAEQLRELGETARPEVLHASRSDNPALAVAAGELLIAMPWHRADDTPAVRVALRNYGQADVVQRIASVSKIAALPRSVARIILARLLVEEPSEDVCWHVVAALRRIMDAQLSQTLRQIEPSHNRASALTIIGQAWIDVDRGRSHELLRRAIAIEARAPTYDDGELDFAFDVLAAADEAAGNYAAAAALRRQQAARVGLQRTAYPEPVYQLFALHARHGPLDDFSRDLQTFTVYLAEPQVLYALAQVYARIGDELMASALRVAARASSLRGRQRLQAADFLRGAGWSDLARRELVAIVAAPPDGAESTIDQINARLRLGALAHQREDSIDAARHLRAALELLESSRLTLQRTDVTGRVIPFDPNDLRGEVAWHAFRAARQANDAQAIARHIDELLRIKPTSSRVVLELVPYLKSQGREADAQKLFEAAYTVYRARLTEAPSDPGAMNELAWLCARAGERLDEALDLATNAVAAAPGTASYLDTAAEANFQVGRIDEAIRLERLAVELEPTSEFMREQLERFETARKK